MTATALAGRRSAYLGWALALLGALLLVAVSQITSVEPDAPAAPADSQELTLGGIRSMEQTFSTSRPGLVGLRIRLRPGGSDPANLSIPFHLRYTDGPPIDLVSANLAPDSADGGQATIRFPPLIASRDPHLLTDTLRLVLDIPDLPPSTGPLITVQKAPSTGGQLIIDGSPQASLALAITPLYQTRWIDRLWPISAMAAGKPGLLGEPGLYLLLAYLYILGLAQGFAELRRVYRADH